MTRLSIVLVFVTGPLITGLILLPLFAFDLLGWGAVGPAAVAGFLLSWPTAYAISRRIKPHGPDADHDPDQPFDHTDPGPRPMPNPTGEKL